MPFSSQLIAAIVRSRPLLLLLADFDDHDDLDSTPEDEDAAGQEVAFEAKAEISRRAGLLAE